MAGPLGKETWAGLRALREGENATFTRLAAVSGMHVSTIRERAAREGWARPDFSGRKADARRTADARPGLSLDDDRASGRGNPADRMQTARDQAAVVVADLLNDAPPDAAAKQKLAAEGGEAVESFLMSEVEGIVADARSGRIDKTRIEAVLSMIRVVERTEQFRRAPKGDEANEKTRSDDELAGLLALVDARIVELARCHAERLGRGEPERAPG